VARVDIGLPG